MPLDASFQNNDLSYCCEQILKSNQTAKQYRALLKHSPDWFEETYNDNVIIQESILLSLINKSIKKKFLRPTMVALVDILKEECITDTVFNCLINYPKKNERQAFIVSLSHKELSEYQLCSLCKIGTEFECFFELALLYYQNDRYSLDDMERFFEEFMNCDFSYLKDVLLQELFECFDNGSVEKKNWLQAQMRQ